jgi:hypothetical protein
LGVPERRRRESKRDRARARGCKAEGCVDNQEVLCCPPFGSLEPDITLVWVASRPLPDAWRRLMKRAWYM